MAFQDKIKGQSAALMPRPLPSAPFVQLSQSLPSRVAIISPFVEQLMRFIARFCKGEGANRTLRVALREALANAIVHGNHESPRKRVYVTCRCTTDGEISITVEDEGEGFNSEAVLDPNTKENRLLTYGRGIYRMKKLMDEVRLERGGAVVHMQTKPIPLQRRTGKGSKES